MATFVLVHPAWFGGWCWKKVASPLRRSGHIVYTPTLTGLGERAHLAHPNVSLVTHIDDVVNLLHFEDLHGVILVGNSSGGTVITGVADRVPESIARVVYLDAFVPDDGQSTRDLIHPDRRSGMEQLVDSEGEGWLLPRFSPAPWEPLLREGWGLSDEDVAWVLPRLRPTPWGHFTEPVHLRNPDRDQVERVYVRARDWPAPHFDEFGRAAQETAGWTYRELNASHIPFISDPDVVTNVLLEFV